MSDLPPEVSRVLGEMQANRWTGSLTLHMVQGEVRGYDQRRSGRVVATERGCPPDQHLTPQSRRA